MQSEESRFAKVKSKLAASSVNTPVLRVVAFIAIHIPLALAIRHSYVVGTVHALSTAFLGLWWAMHGRRMDRVAYIAAYIAGSEVLWRMVRAEVFWEYGKYSTVGSPGTELEFAL